MLAFVLSIIVGLFSLPCLGQVSQNFMTESLPQYELGAGAIGLNLPDYPGSKNTRYRVVPFPYYIYRGKYLRADDEGTRARLLSSKRHETGLSFGFNFPVNSNDNSSRVGMPNLDALMAFGPRVLFRFLTEESNHKLNLSFAVRAVFSSKFSFNNLFKSQGFDFEPRLSYWYRWQKSKTTLFSNLSFEFGSAKINRFFYSVDPQYQTASRPAYLAKAGLIESSLGVGIGQQVSKEVFIFASTSWRNLDLAANNDSPLVETQNNLAVITGFIWTFYESDEKVQPI